MSGFAPKGYLTLKQYIEDRTQELGHSKVSAADLNLSLTDYAEALSVQFGTNLARVENVRKELQTDLYTGKLTAVFVDPKAVESGLKTIVANFWATDAGHNAIYSGRYFPLGEHLKGNPLISGSNGETFYIKMRTKTRPPASPTGLPQKPGPKDNKEKIAEVYADVYEHGHKAEQATLNEAMEKVQHRLGISFGRTKFREAIKIAETRKTAASSTEK